MALTFDAAGIRDAWSKGVIATNYERQQAAVNRSFLRSKQYVYWNAQDRRLEEVPRIPGRIRATMNRLGPVSRGLMSKILRRDLVFEVQPLSPDDAAMRAARLAEAVLRQCYDQLGWPEVRADHAWSTWEAGVALLCVEWDASQGEAIPGTMVSLGDVKVSSLTIHEFVTLPGVRDLERAPWWIRGQAHPPEVVQGMFNLAKEPMPDAYSIDGVWRLGDEQRRSTAPLTQVLTMYHRPFGAEQQGRVMTVVNNFVVADEPWRFPFRDRLNVAAARVIPLPGTWIGHTPISDAVPAQAAYNAAHSSILEHLGRAGNARLWVPLGSVDDVGELTDTPGEAIEYVPVNNLRPTYESPPAMPDWWMRYPGEVRAEIDDMLGYHEVSRGGAPGGVESGVALGILAENDDTPVGAYAKTLAECWARATSMVLHIYSQEVTERRQAVVAPSNNYGVPELAEWTGADLLGHHTVTIPLDSVLPRSRAAQMAYAFQLFDRQIITSPQQLAKIADLPDQNDMLSALDPDTAKAQRENMHMASGTPRLVDMIDDHGNHIAIHRDFMRSARWELLPDEVKTIAVDHLHAHEMYAAQQAAQQAQAAQISPIAAAIPTAATKPIDPATLAAGQALSAAQGMPMQGAPMQGAPMPPAGPPEGAEGEPPTGPGGPPVSGPPAAANGAAPPMQGSQP